MDGITVLSFKSPLRTNYTLYVKDDIEDIKPSQLCIIFDTIYFTSWH